MLSIHCPFCGPRNESEFIHGGTSRLQRPESPQGVSDSAWVDYLTVPENPVGLVEEKWWHARGCGQWLKIKRHTVTHEIIQSRDDGDND